MLITDQAAIMNTPIDSSHKNLHLGLLFHLANQFKDLLIGHYFADSGITAPQFKVLINIFKGNTSPAEICIRPQCPAFRPARPLTSPD